MSNENAVKTDIEKIRLGSGDLYFMEFTGKIPDESEIEKPEHLLGRISGGASLEYKPEHYTAEDDSGIVSRTILTKEEATLKSGVMTWNGNTLYVMSPTARVTVKNSRRVVKIGGRKNDNGKLYVIHFVHTDNAEGDVRVTIVGKNEAGFTLSFLKDKETIIDAEFKAKPHDKEGTLIIYQEDIIAETSLEVEAATGNTVGKTSLTVSPALTDGNSYKYKVADDFDEVYEGDECPDDYTDWDGTSEITATTGQAITLVEVDENNIIVKIGETIAIAKEEGDVTDA